MTDAWGLLGAAGTGVVGAAIVGAIGAVIGARIARRDEHSKWLRDQRLIANKAFYQTFSAIYVGRTKPASADDIFKQALATMGDSGAIGLLGPEDVYDASEALSVAQNVWLKNPNDANKDAMSEAETTYLAAARKSFTSGT